MDCNKTINFLSELKRLCDSRTRCITDAANKEQCPMLGFVRTRSQKSASKML